MGEEEQQEPVGIIGFQNELANIRAALAGFDSGEKADVAIIAEPFAGRTKLIHAIEQIADREVVTNSFSALITDQDEITLPEGAGGIVLCDNCHFLYRRTIGGFRYLDAFLAAVAASEHLVITTWNIYSWRYLDEVRAISKYFTNVIALSPFSSTELKELILVGYAENELKFEDDRTPEKKRIITQHPLAFTMRDKTLTIPFFSIDFARIKALFSRKAETKKAEDIIFEKINRIANGNPGVAKLLWEQSLQYPTIKPSYVKECPFKVELDYPESFLLYLILSMEALTEPELREISGELEVETMLHRLLYQRLIVEDMGSYQLNPEALSCIVSALTRTGVIW
ncbi:MAG TPA: hypothetical protein ENN68_08670 [Methanomicrobia archaeon]|nr:hypothetical protein [Methanomicrobia archaeon]